MGIYAFKLPDIGEGVVEGEVVEWMVGVGDTVAEDQPILSVMTDKATVEIPSPVNGVVVKREGDVGDILPVGAVCIEFEVDGEGNASASEAAPHLLPHPSSLGPSESVSTSTHASSYPSCPPRYHTQFWALPSRWSSGDHPSISSALLLTRCRSSQLVHRVCACSFAGVHGSRG